MRGASGLTTGPRLAIAETLLLAFLIFSSDAAGAGPPAGYYDSALGLTGSALQTALHEIIDDHLRFPYTSSSTDTWDVLSIAHADPSVPGNVLTVYRNKSVDFLDHTQATGWNREHTWPSSYGFTNDGSCNYPFTDLHHLMPADWDYNSARGNRPFDECIVSCAAYPVDGFPGENNFGAGAGPTGSWEVWTQRRGDIARAMFYLAVRYEGGFHGVTGCAEPDLILTDNRAQIVSNTSQNYSPAYMGIRSTLLEWHLGDPVDTFECDKNDVVFGFQGNRNPFIDHPEWVCQVWSCSGVDATPPAAPLGLLGVPGDCEITLAWLPNGELDLAGYNVHRSVGGGPDEVVNGTLLTSPTFVDDTVENGTLYQYELRAVDVAGNVSDPSTPINLTPNGAGSCSGDGFRRGDGNGDGSLDIGDAVFILQVLFSGAPAECQDALDGNDDGGSDIADVVYILAYTFSGGTAPAAPFPGCGVDPTADPLGCVHVATCP